MTVTYHDINELLPSNLSMQICLADCCNLQLATVFSQHLYLLSN